MVANLALTGKGTVRLTPALNMPDSLFDEMLDRVERAASISPKAWRMLVHTKLHTLVGLASLAGRT